jgi:predicted transcriptional regulator
VSQALNEYLKNHEWQVLETIKAIELADSDQAEFIAHNDVKARWKKRREN